MKYTPIVSCSTPDRRIAIAGLVEVFGQRLEKRVPAHAVKPISLPHNNQVRKAMPAALNINRHISPLNATIAACKKRL